jgi:integrase
MAYIQKLTDKPRTLPWRAQVRRKGHKVLIKMFATKAEAEHWTTEQERAIRLTGLPQTIKELEKHHVGEIVERYLKEITPSKGCHVSETTVLKKFLRHEFCRKSLAYASGPNGRQDAYKYRDERLKQTWQGRSIKPSTVRREVNTFHNVFEVAREQWGFSSLQNPFHRFKIKGSMRRRKRRLEEGELERLERACKGCRGLNQYYVPLAIYLAVETGMRQQEIFNLAWPDIEIRNRRIEIRKSKTDHLTPYEGRTIVLTIGAQSFLTRLRFSLRANGQFRSTDRIFPMTKEAFKQSWSDVLRRAGINNLTFHDLRREAGSRFDAAGLTKGEHDLMMGHANRDMTNLYIHADLKSIQDKLDRYVLGGMTFDEAMTKEGWIVMNNGISGKPKAVPFEEAVEEAVRRHGMKFNSEEEMNKAVEHLKKKYLAGPAVPFPPQIGAN